MRVIGLRHRRPARDPRPRLPQERLPPRGPAELPRPPRLEPRRRPRADDGGRDGEPLLDRPGSNKSNPKFDRTKLQAFNTEAAAAMPTRRGVAAFRDYLSVNPESPLNHADDAALARLLSMKKGFRLLREVDEASRFLFVPDEQIAYDPDAVEKVLKKGDGQGLKALRDVRDLLASAPEWTAGGVGGGRQGVLRARRAWAWAKSPNRSAWPSAARPSARRSSRAWRSWDGSGRWRGSNGACRSLVNAHLRDAAGSGAPQPSFFRGVVPGKGISPICDAVPLPRPRTRGRGAVRGSTLGKPSTSPLCPSP